MLVTFSPLSGLEVIDKTVERFYSGPTVALALENLHALMLRRRGGTRVRRDRRGNRVRAEHHARYATTATKNGDRAKKSLPRSSPRDGADDGSSPPKKERGFVSSFRLLDLRTWLYVASRSIPSASISSTAR
jgi:transposase